MAKLRIKRTDAILQSPTLQPGELGITSSRLWYGPKNTGSDDNAQVNAISVAGLNIGNEFTGSNEFFVPAEGAFKIYSGSTKKELLTVTSAGGVYIGGNLMVQGTTDTVNSTNLVISDNFIELNKPEEGTSSTNLPSGLKIHRANNNHNFLYNDENGVWKVASNANADDTLNNVHKLILDSDYASESNFGVVKIGKNLNVTDGVLSGIIQEASSNKIPIGVWEATSGADAQYGAYKFEVPFGTYGINYTDINYSVEVLAELDSDTYIQAPCTVVKNSAASNLTVYTDDDSWTGYVIATSGGEGSSNSSGHTIIDKSGTSFTQRPKLKFGDGFTIKDDATSGLTQVDFEVSVKDATSTTAGIVKLATDTKTNDTAIISNTVGKTYGIQTNSGGQLVVNVPWLNRAIKLNGEEFLNESESTALDLCPGTGIWFSTDETSDAASKLTISAETASTTRLGSIKVGRNLSIESDGTLHSGSLISDDEQFSTHFTIPREANWMSTTGTIWSNYGSYYTEIKWGTSGTDGGAFAAIDINYAVEVLQELDDGQYIEAPATVIKDVNTLRLIICTDSDDWTGAVVVTTGGKGGSSGGGAGHIIYDKNSSPLTAPSIQFTDGLNASVENNIIKPVIEYLDCGIWE